ncbi:hypothetical protein Tco_0548951 [Tanacetum coccineum]
MNYYRSPPVQLAVLDLQKVPVIPAVLSPVPVKWSPVLVKWSPVPVVTASMSKSAQAAPVGVPMPPGKPEPPDLHRYPACPAPELQQARSP